MTTTSDKHNTRLRQTHIATHPRAPLFHSTTLQQPQNAFPRDAPHNNKTHNFNRHTTTKNTTSTATQQQKNTTSTATQQQKISHNDKKHNSNRHKRPPNSTTGDHPLPEVGEAAEASGRQERLSQLADQQQDKRQSQGQQQ